MTEPQSRNWVDIHLDRLVHNLDALRGHIPHGCKVMGVVKANAYGHGDSAVAHALVQAGIDWLAVSNLEEALSLRGQGVDCPILVLIASPVSMVREIAAAGLTQTVFSPEYAMLLEGAAKAAGVRLPVHIKIDTGMTRLGFATEQTEEIAAVCRSPFFDAQGIYTHFASADEADSEGEAYTTGQYKRFLAFLDKLEARGIRFALRHCCNSAGALRHPEMSMDMVRPGLMLYGFSPSPECDGIIPLRPVMEWSAVVGMVRTVPAGVPVSYNRTFKSSATMRIAVIPIGYADGYGREQSNGGWVLVRGQRAPIVGRICMDQLMLDVSNIPDATAGDIVGIAAVPGAQSFDDLARRAGTISYEKACAVGRRVPRIYRKNGEITGITSLYANLFMKML